MPAFVTYIEFSGIQLTDDVADRLLDQLDGFEPSISEPTPGRVGIRTRSEATDLGVASRTIHLIATNALTSLVPDATPVLMETMTEGEFDLREHFDDPDRLTVAEAMEYLGVTRQAVLQQIESGSFAGAQKEGDSYLIPAESVRTRARQRVRLGWSRNSVDAETEMREHGPAILTPMYEDLSIVGALPAYQEALKARRNEPHNELQAKVWRDAERDALEALGALGLRTEGVRFFAEPLRTRGTTGF